MVTTIQTPHGAYEAKVSPNVRPKFLPRTPNPAGEVLAWYVVGETRLFDIPFPTFFRTKEAAEVYARELYPDESPNRRYARIMYREILVHH